MIFTRCQHLPYRTGGGAALRLLTLDASTCLIALGGGAALRLLTLDASTCLIALGGGAALRLLTLKGRTLPSHARGQHNVFSWERERASSVTSSWSRDISSLPTRVNVHRTCQGSTNTCMTMCVLTVAVLHVTITFNSLQSESDKNITVNRLSEDLNMSRFIIKTGHS